jgi:hypothetical protein
LISSASASPVTFSASDCSSSRTKFVLSFHQQNQEPGILVDIRSLANGFFFAAAEYSRIAAHSHEPPSDKFLIIPVKME